MDSIREILKKVITEMTKDISTIGDNDDLKDSGLDSIDFINLVVELEKKFQLFVKDQDLLIENFNTIAKINSYIETNK